MVVQASADQAGIRAAGYVGHVAQVVQASADRAGIRAAGYVGHVAERYLAMNWHVCM